MGSYLLFFGLLHKGVVMKRNICFVLFVSMLFSLLPIQVNGIQNSKIDSQFLTEMRQEANIISIMVELSQSPVVVFSKQTFDQSNYFQNQPFEYGSNGEDFYRRSLLSAQETFLQKMRRSGISFVFRYQCTDVLNSVALSVKGKDIHKLAMFPEIRKIYDDRKELYAMRDIAVLTTGADRVWQGVESKGSFTGKGVVVGVIDTGLDKTHSKSGEFVGRVLGGYDYADGDGDYDDIPEVGHGTHVAGIIGGKGKLDSQKGMAYETKFRIYKVFTYKRPGAYNTPGAIDKAVSEKCKVINMSLGSEGPSPAKNTEYYADAITNASKAGTLVVAAAGNAGSRGRNQEYPIGSPASAEDAFSVAATNDRQQVVTITVSTGSETRTISANSASGTKRFDAFLNNKEIIDCGFGQKDDFEKDVTGKIALIQRGPIEDKKKNIKSITFREKMDNAIEQGALAVLLYNNTSGVVSPTVFKEGDDTTEIKTIPIAAMIQEDGLWLKSILGSLIKSTYEASTKNIIADFSSEGPTIDGYFKPEISAPGKDILSTFPKGKYAAKSGTSMSCPVVTGLVALVMQANTGWSCKQIKSAFMNTAELMINPYNNLPITFQLQGAGEARVDRAIVTPAFIEPSAIVIQKGKIQPGNLDPNNKVMFTITSNSSSDKSYPLSYTIFGFPDEKCPITIAFDSNNLSVPSKKKTNLNVQYSVDWNDFNRSRYEGIIKLGDELHIPFIIYRDSVDSIPSAISDIRVSPADLIFTKEGPNPDIQINFSLNAGLEVKYEYAQGGTDYYNYVGLSAVIVDSFGEIWSTVPCLPLYMVGDYEIHWNGKSPDGKYVLPRGKFYIQFKIMGYDYDKQAEFLAFTSQKDSKTLLNVKESFVPSPTPAILSAYKMITINTLFDLKMIIPEVIDCIGIEFELMYDANKLVYKNAVDGGFLSSDTTNVTCKHDDDGDKGILMVRLLREEKTGISGKNALMALISFKAIETGKLKFSIRTSRILFADDTAGRIKAVSPDTRISKKNDYLMADLNADKIVDQFDMKIFMDSYPSKEKDSDYKSVCDFNQDRCINFEDFLVLAKEYGNSI